MKRYPRTVYALKQRETGRVYVGSSTNVKKRICEHRSALKRHAHTVGDLQADYEAYGESFDVEELDVIESEAESYKEYEWMAKLGSRERGRGYNYMDKAYADGRKREKKEKVPTLDDFVMALYELVSYYMDLLKSDPERAMVEIAETTKEFQEFWSRV